MLGFLGWTYKDNKETCNMTCNDLNKVSEYLQDVVLVFVIYVIHNQNDNFLNSMMLLLKDMGLRMLKEVS